MAKRLVGGHLSPKLGREGLDVVACALLEKAVFLPPHWDQRPVPDGSAEISKTWPEGETLSSPEASSLSPGTLCPCDFDALPQASSCPHPQWIGCTWAKSFCACTGELFSCPHGLPWGGGGRVDVPGLGTWEAIWAS